MRVLLIFLVLMSACSRSREPSPSAAATQREDGSRRYAMTQAEGDREYVIKRRPHGLILVDAQGKYLFKGHVDRPHVSIHDRQGAVIAVATTTDHAVVVRDPSDQILAELVMTDTEATLNLNGLPVWQFFLDKDRVVSKAFASTPQNTSSISPQGIDDTSAESYRTPVEWIATVTTQNGRDKVLLHQGQTLVRTLESGSGFGPFELAMFNVEEIPLVVRFALAVSLSHAR